VCASLCVARLPDAVHVHRAGDGLGVDASLLCRL